ncbi:MAG: helix-turn-helix transcriptional regulator [Flavobacteriales bacterium]|nr:helix-turn-helix transcriptional regulator [Flavobacteriales bacterium]
MKENDLKKLIAHQIKLLRKEKNLTQQSLGDFFDESQQNVQEIERGTRNLGVFKLYKITKALKLKLSEFFKLIGL